MIKWNKDMSSQYGEYNVSHPGHGKHSTIVVHLRGYANHKNSRNKRGQRTQRYYDYIASEINVSKKNRCGRLSWLSK